jgi:hypothetical protein
MITYLIECDKCVKIGRTENLAQRYRTLQTGSPYELKLIGWFEGDREFEFHNKYKDHKIKGEWFSIDGVIELYSHQDIIKTNLFFETYGCYNTTNGIDWILNFDGKEIQIIMNLLYYEDNITKQVVLNSTIRKELLKVFNIKKSTLSGLLKTLCDKGYILKIELNKYIVNPLYFFNGDYKYTMFKYKEIKAMKL